MNRPTSLKELAQKAAKNYFSPMRSGRSYFLRAAAEEEDNFGETFVRTHTYSAVKSQSACIVVGSRGTGKSALTIALAGKEVASKQSLDILGREIDFDAVASILSKANASVEDGAITRGGLLLRSAWIVLLESGYLSWLVSFADRSGPNTKLNAAANALRMELESTNAPLTWIPSAGVRPAQSFVVALEICVDFLDDGSTASSLRRASDSALGLPTSLQRFVRGSKAFHECAVQAENTDARPWVTADGIAEALNVWTASSSRPQAETENVGALILGSLIDTVLQLKSGRTSGFLDGKLNYCVTLTEMAYRRLLEFERDSYRVAGNAIHLHWTGIELAVLLRKRLASIARVEDAGTSSPVERLSDLLRTEFPRLPHSVSLRSATGDRRIDLFLFVLRNTFWRPREVLRHFSQIIGATEASDEMLPAELVQRIVMEVNFELVSDFVREYSELEVDLIMRAFQGSDQIISCEVLRRILSSEAARLAARNDDVSTPESLLRILFDIGFLGFSAPPDVRKRLGFGHSHCFSFNEGAALDRLAASNLIERARFLIHPIFSDILQLVKDPREPVLDFDWEYLQKAEITQFARGNPLLLGSIGA